MKKNKNIETIKELSKYFNYYDNVIDITDFLILRKNIASDLLAIAAQIDEKCFNFENSNNYISLSLVDELEKLSTMVLKATNAEGFDSAIEIVDELKTLIKI